MPSKGVQCYTYSSVNGVEVEYTVPKQSKKRGNTHEFTIDHLEVDKSNLSPLKFSGRFEFIVRRDGRELTRQWVVVNTLTGKLEDGTMVNMDQTPSVFTEGLFISYGLYDSGPGLANLPKQHQCYVTVTYSYENWMRDVIPPNDDKSNRPFNKMVLASAHDIGMNSMQTSMGLIKKAGTGIIKEVLGRSLPNVFDIFNKVGDGAINRIAPDIIRALAITQKDSLETILKLGARYCEFRPAKCHRQMQRVSSIEDTWYFQHGAIPGMQYTKFLSDIVQFLCDHSDEIIIVQNRWDGVPGECPRPSDDELRDIVNETVRDKDIEVGNQDDMLNKSIRDLRNEKKRLIVLKNTAQVSNYDDNANATLTGGRMVTKLNEMAQNPPNGHPILLLQCQATATNIRDVIIASVVSADVSTSPILATKGTCDNKILPLLRGDTGRKIMKDEGVTVLMNDFFDGGTADTAINMCRERLG